MTDITEPLITDKDEDTIQLLGGLGSPSLLSGNRSSPQSSSSGRSQPRPLDLHMQSFHGDSVLDVSVSAGGNLDEKSYELFSRSIEKSNNSVLDPKAIEREIKRRFAVSSLSFRTACVIIILLLIAIGAIIIADATDSDKGAWYRQVSAYYFAGSLITLVSGIYVLSSYWALGPLNRHPAPLYVWQTVCDLILVVPVIINVIEDRLDEDRNFGRSPITCKLTAILTQVSLYGSTAWFATLALDLYLSTKNPFSNTQLYLRRYHIVVWVFTGLTSLIVALDEEGHKPCHMCICWIESGKGNEINYRMWFAYYAWQVLFFLTAFVILYFCISQLNFDFRKTLLTKDILNIEGKNGDDIRLRVVQQNAFHIFSLATYFLVVAILYRIYDTQREDPETAEEMENDGFLCNVETQPKLPILKALAVLISGKGALNALIWYRKNYESFAKEEVVVKASLSQTLRNDVIRTTIAGIAETALMASGPKIEDPFNKSNYNCLLEMNVEGQKTHGSFVFKSYAMLAFRHMRESQGITTESYITSLKGKPGDQGDDKMNVKESFSEGRSGSFLYFSKDGRFVVKTMSAGEAQFLLGILPNFHQHITNNKHTLINHLYGLHSIDIYGLRMYFAVMENVIQLPSHRERQACYDLKGSTVDRYVYNADSFKEQSSLRSLGSKLDSLLAWIGLLGVPEPTLQSSSASAAANKKKKITTLKDQNFMDDMKKIHISAEMRAEVLKQIREDVRFFTMNNIMDYSLLLVVSTPKRATLSPRPSFSSITSREAVVNGTTPPHLSNSIPSYEAENPEHSAFFRRHEGGIQDMSVNATSFSGSIRDMRRAYHIGIIDILQEYNFSKKLERFIKSYLYGKDPNGISCIPPTAYGERFEGFLEDIFVR